MSRPGGALAVVMLQDLHWLAVERTIFTEEMTGPHRRNHRRNDRSSQKKSQKKWQVLTEEITEEMAGPHRRNHRRNGRSSDQNDTDIKSPFI
jgi:hypothetical protein